MLDSIKIKSIRALNDHVLVKDMNFKERKLSSGIYLLNDDGRSAGIRPRWAQIYSVGPDQEDVNVGQWILVAHGRWTRGVKIEDNNGELTLRRIDPNDILLVSDSEPAGDDTLSDATQIDSKGRW
jgi:co-chaperonin GroES (HSP10)